MLLATRGGFMGSRLVADGFMPALRAAQPFRANCVLVNRRLGTPRERF
jgi:hypothetical protein